MYLSLVIVINCTKGKDVHLFQSKHFLIGGSVVGAFLLVYGSAISNRLLVGDYMMSGGLLDPNYMILAVLCAVPFVLSSLYGTSASLKKQVNMILVSGILFGIHFIIVHWAFVYYEVEMAGSLLTRTFLVFPISAFCIVVATYFGLNMEVQESNKEYSLD